jgi:triosephosphate isomerase
MKQNTAKDVNNKFLVANFKMNKTNLEIAQYFSVFNRLCGGHIPNNVIFCVPSTSLYFTSLYNVKVGAQNIFYEENGAYTGEVSAKMVVDCGAEYVIIGHSERRAWFMETDEIINSKVLTAIKHKLTVILCIGETNIERAEGRTREILTRQITRGLIDVYDLEKIIIAYEPVWAIGGNTAAKNEHIREVLGIIDEVTKTTVKQKIPIIYGGSVNEDNAKEILTLDGIDGLLVGGASLNPEKFHIICKIL